MARKKLDIQSEYIENVYLIDHFWEKIWTRGSPEFGQDWGEVFIIVMELYGLK